MRIMVPCPVCWHTETAHANAAGRVPEHTGDTTPHMMFRAPYGGARNQTVTRGDEGVAIRNDHAIRRTHGQSAVKHHAALIRSQRAAADLTLPNFVEVTDAFRGGQRK